MNLELRKKGEVSNEWGRTRRKTRKAGGEQMRQQSARGGGLRIGDLQSEERVGGRTEVEI